MSDITNKLRRMWNLELDHEETEHAWTEGGRFLVEGSQWGVLERGAPAIAVH